ncbi:hypothetical protein K501DRAFT_308870 [Backusella circina FSU 941]|nr:hypothetical protein K501DRAFT_308870 [Backusella circina FSU 941]
MLDPQMLPQRRSASTPSTHPDKQKDIKNSISATLCTTKLWHATIQTLPLPLPTRNRIILQEQQQEANTIGNLFRRLTRNSTLKKNHRSNTERDERPAWLCKKGNDVFLKSPYVVAGGELTGSVVIQTSAHILSGFQSLCIRLIGVEVVTDPNNPSQTLHNYNFLNTQHTLVDKNTLSTLLKDNKINVPFTIPLSSQLGGTFYDRKGSVKYYLESEITHSVSENAEETPSKYVIATRPLTLYANCVSMSLADVHLYSQQSQSIEIWREPSFNTCVSVDSLIPRTIWMAGASIYITLKLQTSSYHSVSDIKLELIRKQNTFPKAAIAENNTLPLSSTCDVVAQVSLSKMDWWQPLFGEIDEEIIVSLNSPNDQVTICSQKLIEVSFAIQVSLSCPETTTAVAEFPITLVHPISMDPPPGNYTTSKSLNSHLFLQENFQRKDEEELGSPIVSFLPLDMETSSIVKSSHDSCRDSYFADTEAAASRKSSFVSTNMFEERNSIYSLDTVASSAKRNPLNKMHKSLSDWTTSSSQMQSKQTYLSPDRLESSRSSILSISSSLTEDKSSERLFLRCSNKLMRFGQVGSGPKQFGHHPNCLGDASLDIRKHYAENMQEALADPTIISENLEENDDCYHYGDDEDTDIDSTANTRRKIYKNSVVSLDSLDSRSQEYEINSMDVPEKFYRPRYPLSHSNSGTKRILASSRYLKSIQRKGMQPNGRFGRQEK